MSVVQFLRAYHLLEHLAWGTLVFVRDEEGYHYVGWLRLMQFWLGFLIFFKKVCQLFFFLLRRMGKNTAQAHHASTYFHTRRVSI